MMNGHCWILGPHPNPMIASCSFWPDLRLVQPCFSIASRFSMISLKLPPLLQIRQPYICPLSVNLWDFLPPRNWIHFPVQNVRWLQASKITQPRSLPDNSRPWRPKNTTSYRKEDKSAAASFFSYKIFHEFKSGPCDKSLGSISPT